MAVSSFQLSPDFTSLGKDESAKKAWLYAKVVSSIRTVLRVSDEDDLGISMSSELADLGIDSIKAIKLKEMVEGQVGTGFQIDVQDFMHVRTVEAFVTKLLYLLSVTDEKKRRAEEKAEIIKLAKEDLILPAHIKAGPRKPVWIEETKVFLLTGATGQLAPYLLEILTHRKTTTKVVCLVRPNKAQKDGSLRLREHLKSIDMLDRIDMSKVTVVSGNIVEERMGMSEEDWEKLTEEVDVVVNCACNANHLAKYVKEDVKYGGVRAVNYVGVLRVLEFACAKRTKWVYQGSTILCTAISFSGFYTRHPEEWHVDILDSIDNLPNMGYSATKAAAECILHAATQRGIPCKVFRFGKIGGDKTTGRSKVMENHFFVKFLYYIIGGVMPDFNVALIQMSVDACAEVSLRLFFDERTQASDIYAVVPPYSTSELDLAVFGEEFGVQLQILYLVANVVAKFGEEEAVTRLNQMAEGGPFARLIKIAQETYGSQWMRAPEKLFENAPLMDALRPVMTSPTEIVTWAEYKKTLIAKGKDSILGNWLEFYTKEDSLFQMMADKKFPVMDFWLKDKEAATRWTKAELLIPNLREIVEDPLNVVRRDIAYTIRHARDIFLPHI